MFRVFAHKESASTAPPRGASHLWRALGLALCTTMVLASSASRTEAQSLIPGQEVYLKCEAFSARDDHAIWLDGNTATTTVGLAPNTNFPYTGTRWKVVDLGDGAIGLLCLGHLNGPRWLDGNTIDGTVWLRDFPSAPFTGTRWKVYELGNRMIKLQTLGLVDGPRFLDGVTSTKKTRLTFTDGYPGNVWSVWNP